VFNGLDLMHIIEILILLPTILKQYNNIKSNSGNLTVTLMLTLVVTHEPSTENRYSC